MTALSSVFRWLDLSHIIYQRSCSKFVQIMTQHDIPAYIPNIDRNEERMLAIGLFNAVPDLGIGKQLLYQITR